MNTSLFELFKIGIGPSSSHTVGPMRAALRFARELDAANLIDRTHHIVVDLYGSLALTGIGHGTDRAILLGLSGEAPDSVDPATIEPKIAAIRSTGSLKLLGRRAIPFVESEHLLFHRDQMYPIAAKPAPSLTPISENDVPAAADVALAPNPDASTSAPEAATHPNGLRVSAFDADNNLLAADIFYSVGGGFIVSQAEFHPDAPIATASRVVPYPFSSAEQLLNIAEQNHLSIAELVLANEIALLSDTTINRPKQSASQQDRVRPILPELSRNSSTTLTAEVEDPQQQIEESILALWQTMQSSTDRGLATEGILPGGLNVRRRAPRLSQKLNTNGSRDPLAPMDWVTIYAMAVNEENAAGGRVVTAPTNGAAGVIPAIAHYYSRFIDPLTGGGVPGDAPSTDSSETERRAGLLRYFLTAAAIGILYKENASISGAEVGCQGEVGVACSMAAGGLVAALNGTNAQIEHAAEIAMEHNLGMTCDPIGGLVQIPCIERNGMGAVKAINAARLAMAETEGHKLSLDQIIETMYRTGMDMQSRYKETSLAGLALNIIEC